MDLRLAANLGASALGGLARAGAPAAGAAAAVKGPAGANFANALDNALKAVSSSQHEAASLQRQYQLGVDSVSLESTMVSMQKAQVGFQAALTVRNRLVSAYSDIMNMQV